MPLLALGPHKFELEPLNFQDLEDEFEVKWPAISRFGGRPARQMTGDGEDPIRITGLLWPHEVPDSREALEAVIRTQKAKRPVLMMRWASDAGMRAQVDGLVVILRISRQQSKFGTSGNSRRLDYDIEIAPIPAASGKPVGLIG